MKGTTMKKANKTVVAEPKWETIEDEKVKHVWCCPRCNKFAEVDPTFYQDSGNPMCDSPCDTEMEYIHTLIQLH